MSSFSEDTGAQIEDAIESIPAVVEAPLPCPVAEIPESNDVGQQILAVILAETFEVPPYTINEALIRNEVEQQLTESTSVGVETPCSITVSETPASGEVEQQLPAIIPLETPQASNTDWYVPVLCEMHVG